MSVPFSPLILPEFYFASPRHRVSIIFSLKNNPSSNMQFRDRGFNILSIACNGLFNSSRFFASYRLCVK